MKLRELFKRNEYTLSFEVFPPKAEDGYESVKRATEEIARLSPAFMSVTYGAGGGTSQYTLDIAKNIKQECAVESVAHLTCVSSTRETVRARIADFQRAGIENIMALRGDIPESMRGMDPSERCYRYAVDLIADIKVSGAEFCIGGACYPEMHPESKTREEDILHLKEKVEAGCEFLTTQMFFDNRLLYEFLADLRGAGVTVPVVAGIMPITNAKQVERAINLSGSFIPKRFQALVDECGKDPLLMRKVGIAYAVEQILELYANGIKNVHVYSMNKPDTAAEIQKSVAHIMRKNG